MGLISFRGRIPMAIYFPTSSQALNVGRKCNWGSCEVTISDAESDHCPRMFTPHHKTHEKLGKANLVLWYRGHQTNRKSKHND